MYACISKRPTFEKTQIVAKGRSSLLRNDRVAGSAHTTGGWGSLLGAVVGEIWQFINFYTMELRDLLQHVRTVGRGHSDSMPNARLMKS
jgi:hypothetical protein